jgi:hypothetical protein
MPAAAARTRRGERVGEVAAAAVRRWGRRRVESIGVGGRVRGRGRWEKTGAEAAGDMWTAPPETPVASGSNRVTSLRRFRSGHVLD